MPFWKVIEDFKPNSGAQLRKSNDLWSCNFSNLKTFEFINRGVLMKVETLYWSIYDGGPKGPSSKAVSLSPVEGRLAGEWLPRGNAGPCCHCREETNWHFKVCLQKLFF